MKQRKIERKDKQPLLYIAQPPFDETRLNMQRTFVIKPEVELQQDTHTEDLQHVEEQAELESSKELESAQMEIELTAAASESVVEDKEAVEEGTNKVTNQGEEASPQEQEEQQSDGSWKSKPFKEMSNTEKIGFLIHRPHYIPKVKCQIRTSRQAFIGYVLSYEDGDVTIKLLGSEKEVKVNQEEIVSIRLMGL
ncbi:CotO family spore coat protein [Microbacteriaceae bacterium 4G12]